MGGFLRANRADWENACEALTGDHKAVRYLWEGVVAELGLGEEVELGLPPAAAGRSLNMGQLA